MKHDRHYVEELSSRAAPTVGQLLPLDSIKPGPAQPRKDFDDLDELSRSIKQKGVLEPILVQPANGGFTIVAGERRYRASLLAGLKEIPAIVLRDLSENAALEIALIENLQRKDLNPFEEADGLSQLQERFGYTHEMLARKLGKARSSVTETLRIASLTDEVRRACEQASVLQKSLLLEVLKQPDRSAQLNLVHSFGRGAVKREEARRSRRKPGPGRPKNYVFRYAPAGSRTSLELRFGKARVTQAEVIKTLEQILHQLRKKP
jgi:ParB family chromosome partitioning protein